MAIIRLASATGGGGTATSVAVNLPTTTPVQAGDVSVWQGYLESTGAVVPSPGYTLASRISNTTASNAFDEFVYWKRFERGETGSHTFTHPSAWTAAVMVIYRGCIGTGIPIDKGIIRVATTVNATTCNAGPLYPSRDGVQVVGGAGFGGTLTGPTGMFDVQNFSDLVFSDLIPYKIGGFGTGVKTISGGSQSMATIMFQMISALNDRRRG